jgi:hypothetical protein
MENFTGNPDSDIAILKELDYNSLIQLCAASKYFQSLCEISSLWKHLLIRDYPSMFSLKPENMSYRNFYDYVFRIIEDLRKDMRGLMEFRVMYKSGLKYLSNPTMYKYRNDPLAQEIIYRFTAYG